MFHDYLEQVAQLQYRPADVYQYRETEWDQYRFICYELVLYLAAICIRYGKFAILAKFTSATYFYDSNVVQQHYESIALFNHYIMSLDQSRDARLQLRRVSVSADMIKTRAEGSGLSLEELVAADLLLHYVTLLNTSSTTELPWQPHVWFPRLSLYNPHGGGVPALRKMISRRHFDRVKILFGVNTPEELIAKINDSAEKIVQYYTGANSFYYHIPGLASAFPVDNLASMP